MSARHPGEQQQYRGQCGKQNALKCEAAPSVIRLTVSDLSAAPYLDLAGSRMLGELNAELAGRGIALRIIGAHGSTRDLLRAEGLEEKVGGLDRTATLDSVLRTGVV